MSSQQRTTRRKSLRDRLESVKSAIVNAMRNLAGQPKVIKRYMPAYIAAKNTGPNSLWRPQNYSSDAAILSCADAIKAKARDAARNNAFISGSLAKIVNNIVGSMLSVQFLFTKPNGELDDQLNDILELRCREWARHAMLDRTSFTEMAKIIVHTQHVDGEILRNHVIDSRVTRGNPYRVQLFENDYLDISKGNNGIDFDQFGTPTAFHIFDVNPSDKLSFLGQLQSAYRGKSRPISADNMSLIRYRLRSSGYRGISELAAIINGAYSLDQLQAAELNAMRTAQAFGLIVTSPHAQDIAENMEYNGDTREPEDEREEMTSIPNPGGVGYLNPGEKVETVKSERPNSNFMGFVKLLLRYLGSGLSTSYSEVANDYSEGSYSSLRQEALIVERIYRAKQAHLDEALREIIKTWLINELIYVGIPGLSVGRLVSRPEDIERFHICFPGFPWVDPEKGMNAFKMEIETGLKTRAAGTAETYGTDWNSNIRQLAREKRMMEQLGLLPAPGPSSTAKGLYKWLT